MSALEDRVRDALRADAATVRPDSLPGVPGRPKRPAAGRPGSRRTRLLMPLAAAAAVIAIVTGLSLTAPYLLSGGKPGSGAPGPLPTGPSVLPTVTTLPTVATGPPQPPVLAADASRGVPSSGPAPGLPRFYVTSYIAPEGPLNYIVIRDTMTGQVVGRINPHGTDFFGGLAATAGDRTFITAVNQDSANARPQLYWFQLNQSGAPGPLESLHITLPGQVPESMGGLAITPDGATIAYKAGGEVGLINLATRQVRFWADNRGTQSPDDLLLSQITGLSLSADGQVLAFSTFGGTYVLQTSAPAGLLYAHSRLVSRTMIWAALAQDGQSLYGCTISPHPGGALPVPDVGTLAYSRLSLTSGRDDVIARWTKVKGPQCDASIDTEGNALLVQFPTIAHGVEDWSRYAILDVATGQLSNINAPAFFGPFNIAW